VKDYYGDVAKKSVQIRSLQDLLQNPITESYKSPQSLLERLAPEGADYVPPGYRQKTTSGVGAIMNSIIESASKLASSISVETEDDFWYLWEVLPNEAEAGLYNCLRVSEKHLLEGLSSIVTAGNATYIFGICYVFAVFWLVFGSIFKALKAETKCSRNGKLTLIKFSFITSSYPGTERK
jgi:hypothetical protein